MSQLNGTEILPFSYDQELIALLVFDDDFSTTGRWLELRSEKTGECAQTKWVSYLLSKCVDARNTILPWNQDTFNFSTQTLWRLLVEMWSTIKRHCFHDSMNPTSVRILPRCCNRTCVLWTVSIPEPKFNWTRTFPLWHFLSPNNWREMYKFRSMEWLFSYSRYMSEDKIWNISDVSGEW